MLCRRRWIPQLPEPLRECDSAEGERINVASATPSGPLRIMVVYAHDAEMLQPPGSKYPPSVASAATFLLIYRQTAAVASAVVRHALRLYAFLPRSARFPLTFFASTCPWPRAVRIV